MMKLESNQKIVLICIMLIIGVCETAISFYIPLLPVIREQLHASEYLIQQSVTSYLLGIGISAVIYGALSDSIGRRRIIIFGIFLFFLASFACVWVQKVELLIFLRFIQGIGAGVAWAIGNAAIRDVFTGKKFAKAMVLIHTVAGIEPAASYLLGSYVGDIIGWRNCFLIISIITLALLMYCLVKLPETIKKKKNILFKSLFNNYYVLAKNKKFLLYLSIKVLIVSVLFVEITNLPLVFIEQYGLSMPIFGLNIVIGVVLYILGGFINTKLLDYYNPEKIIKIGLIFILASNMVLPFLIHYFGISTYMIQLVKLPYFIGLAFIFGNATFCIVNIFPEIAGSASAKMITMEMFVSSLATYFISLFYNGTLYPVIIFTLVAATISYLFLEMIMRSE